MWVTTLLLSSFVLLLLPPKSAKFYESDLGVNRKRICNVLLVINSNYGRVSYSFRDIDAFSGCRTTPDRHFTIATVLHSKLTSVLQ